jgi:hypothetical protein
MQAVGADQKLIAEVDAAMKKWQQGDVIRSIPFVFLADTARPSTSLSREVAKGGSFGPIVVQSAGDGGVVISQTCDIVAKSAAQSPFVNVAALIELDDDVARHAASGDQPRYVHVPRLGTTWFADLDQLQTVEKAMLVDITPVHGVLSDDEQSAFGSAVGRKFSRFPFPDDLHPATIDLQRRIKKKHRQDSSQEGKLLQRVQQIRVEAHPDWQSDSLELTISFILPVGELLGSEMATSSSSATAAWLEGATRAPAELAARMDLVSSQEDRTALWEHLAESWARLCTPTGCVASIAGEVISSDEYSIERYWRSERLDLDHLSREMDTTG